MADRITIYQKPSCTTCREVHAALTAAGVDFTAVNYYLEPLSESKLSALVKKLGQPARSLFRTKEAVHAELNLGSREVPDDEAIRLMVKHPDLLQRPIVEKGDRAILARPSERLSEIL